MELFKLFDAMNSKNTLIKEQYSKIRNQKSAGINHLIIFAFLKLEHAGKASRFIF